MSRCVTYLVAVVALALFGPSVRADVKDVAELFPADTPAFAEIVRPGEFVSSVAALLHGSPIADPLQFIHNRIDKAKLPQDVLARHRSGWLALLAAPELSAEVKRVRGTAVGLVGFNPRHEPRFAAATLLGDSHALGLAVRAFLTTAPDIRRVGTVEGVPIFQHRAFSGRAVDENGPAAANGKETEQPPLPQPGDMAEWTYAYAPGLFVVGSDQQAVADVLRRFAGKGVTASLASSESFQTCRESRQQPGILVYAIPPVLFSEFEAANKASGSKAGADLLALLRFAVDPRSIQLVRANLSLEGDVITLGAEARLYPNRNGPLASLLSGPRTSRDDFRLASGRPGWMVTVSLPDRDQRAKALMALFDSIAKANGALGRLPSQVIAEADRGTGPKVADDLLSSVVQITMFNPEKSTLPVGGKPWPMITLRTQVEKDAERWEQAIAKVIGLAMGATETLTPSVELVNGVRIISVAGKGLAGNTPWHLARMGSLVTFGQDRSLVAESVARMGAALPWPARMTERPSVMMALVKPSTLFATPTKTPKPGPRLGPPAFLPGREPVQALESLSVDLARILDPIPPVYVSVSRDRDRLLIELRLPAASKPIASTAERFLTWMESQPVPASDPRILDLRLER